MNLDRFVIYSCVLMSVFKSISYLGTKIEHPGLALSFFVIGNIILLPISYSMVKDNLASKTKFTDKEIKEIKEILNEQS